MLSFLPKLAVARLAFTMFVLALMANNLFAAKPPAMAEVTAVVDKHLRSNSDYVPGDLISRQDIEPIFNELLDLGILSAGQEDLYDDFVPDSSPLVKALRNPSGRKFMQKVKAIPGVYDRLERLSWTSNGRDLIDQLVRDPQGATLLQAMLQPAGRSALAKFLGDDPSGKNFLIPTGHIHTANEVLKRLEAVLAPKK